MQDKHKKIRCIGVLGGFVVVERVDGSVEAYSTTVDLRAVLALLRPDPASPPPVSTRPEP